LVSAGDEPAFEINPVWLVAQIAVFVLFVLLVVWLVRLLFRSRH
jgi:hypothetical protein